MTNLAYKILERRQKIYIKVYAILCAILILSFGFYTYNKWREYSLKKSGISQNQTFIEFLRNEVTKEKNAYQSQKFTFDKLNRETAKNLETIFPQTDAYTALTRQIDAYEEQLAKKNETFEISNIDYQATIEGENYSILPLRMNIRSSRNNFNKFLQLIESSGALSGKLRLMEISSIRLNFENLSEKQIQNQIINFSVHLNAYFQK